MPATGCVWPIFSHDGSGDSTTAIIRAWRSSVAVARVSVAVASLGVS
ncbi:MAG: hypothetical protein KY467_06370 [Gemmatimonadetes bacterium]|nr:hypothetical protein [Gemmatimonadota bacterium]